MWSKQQTVAEPPAASPSQAPAPVVPFSQSASPKLSSPPARSAARLGGSIQIKGEVYGTEDLQIDGIVEGPISLKGYELTVGSSAQRKSEIHAGNVVAYANVLGNVHPPRRVQIQKHGSIIRDIHS